MRVWLTGLVSAAALLSACGQQTTTTNLTSAARQSQSAAQAASPDALFLAAAATYESYQIQAADIAAAKGRSQAVKTYAANAATTHRATLQALTHAAQSSGMPAPSSDLNEDYGAYIDRLRADDQTPFDVRYVSEQTLVTMSMAGRYDAFTSMAPDSPLKQWATSRSRAVHDEITAAHQLATDTMAH